MGLRMKRLNQRLPNKMLDWSKDLKGQEGRERSTNYRSELCIFQVKRGSKKEWTQLKEHHITGCLMVVELAKQRSWKRIQLPCVVCHYYFTLQAKIAQNYLLNFWLRGNLNPCLILFPQVLTRETHRIQDVPASWFYTSIHWTNFDAPLNLNTAWNLICI